MRNSLNSSLSSHPLNNQFQRMLTNVARSNFHALPLGGAMRNMPHQWKENFENLSKNAAVYDVSYAGTVLNSFFSPKGALANAQEAAASAFGANEAFFTSCGTTISNRIALEALSRKGRRVLMDAASHQSMEFSARALDLSITSIPSITAAVGEGTYWDFPDLRKIIDSLSAAAKKGEPYDVVVLTAASYDGYLVDMSVVLEEVVRNSPSTNILVDAAWSGIHSFSSKLEDRYNACRAIKKIATDGLSCPEVIVTTSVHKTMRAFRQGSILLIASGSAETSNAVSAAKFAHHTTSPSWLILSSVELACAHAYSEGERLVKKSIDNRDYVRSQLQEQPILSDLLPKEPEDSSALWALSPDPMKLLLDVSILGNPEEVRTRLFYEYGIYVARAHGSILVLSFTIGINDDDADRLIRALIDLVKQNRRRCETVPQIGMLPGSILKNDIVPYPPGIPIARAGDVWTERHEEVMKQEIYGGAEIFLLPRVYN